MRGPRVRETEMKRFLQIASVGALAFAWCIAMPAVAAEQAPAAGVAQTGPAQAALQKDVACTGCHGPSSPKPTFAIYQTRHGNKADPRTPGCENCHGQSATHIKDPASAPDVVFGGKSKHMSSADARSASCLACHESKVLPQANWAGSQHQSRDVTCSDCHNIHAPDQKVLSKATQARGVLHVPQGAACADATHLGPSAGDHEPGEHSQDGVFRLSQSTRFDGPEAAGQEFSQRDLLHVSRGKARSVPVGTCACQRRLHQLPHAAWLDDRAAPQGPSAVALPGVPQRRPRRSNQQRREIWRAAT